MGPSFVSSRSRGAKAVVTFVPFRYCVLGSCVPGGVLAISCPVVLTSRAYAGAVVVVVSAGPVVVVVPSGTVVGVAVATPDRVVVGELVDELAEELTPAV